MVARGEPTQLLYSVLHSNHPSTYTFHLFALLFLVLIWLELYTNKVLSTRNLIERFDHDKENKIFFEVLAKESLKNCDWIPAIPKTHVFSLITIWISFKIHYIQNYPFHSDSVRQQCVDRVKRNQQSRVDKVNEIQNKQNITISTESLAKSDIKSSKSTG